MGMYDNAPNETWEGDPIPTPHERPDQYCIHGKYKGDPYGYDYICGYCEDGVTQEEWDAMKADEARYDRRKERYQAKVEDLPNLFRRVSKEEYILRLTRLLAIGNRFPHRW